MWRSFWETWRRSAPSSRCWSNLWRSAPSRSCLSLTVSLQQHSHSFTVRPGTSSGGPPVLQGCWLKPLRRQEIHCSVVLHKHMSVVLFYLFSRLPESQQRVGGFFLNLMPQMKALYTGYCSNHPSAVNVLTQHGYVHANNTTF